MFKVKITLTLTKSKIAFTESVKGRILCTLI